MPGILDIIKQYKEPDENPPEWVKKGEDWLNTKLEKIFENADASKALWIWPDGSLHPDPAPHQVEMLKKLIKKKEN